MGRIELPTSPLPRECSTTEPHGHAFRTYANCPNCVMPLCCTKLYYLRRHALLEKLCASPGFNIIGAGEGNRTLVVSLEGFCSTIELHPPIRLFTTSRLAGGEGWIRTNVGVSQQIYSLPPLATRAPLRGKLLIMWGHHRFVKQAKPFSHYFYGALSVLQFFYRAHLIASKTNVLFLPRIAPEIFTEALQIPNRYREFLLSESPHDRPYHAQDYSTTLLTTREQQHTICWKN